MSPVAQDTAPLNNADTPPLERLLLRAGTTPGQLLWAAYGITAAADSRIRTLADTNGYAPSGIVDILLGREPDD